MADLGGYERVRQASLPGLPKPPRPTYSAKRWKDFAQQFSAAQKQTEAFHHILPRRSAAVSTLPPAAAPPSARRPRARSCCLHLRSSSATAAAFTTATVWSWPQESGAARLHPCQAREAPGKAASLRRATRSLWILLFRRWHHSFPRRRAGWRIFCFLFVLFRHWPSGKKRAVSFSSGSQEGEDGSARDPVSTLLSCSPFASGQQGPVRGRDTFSRAPCPAMEPGECRTTHSDPTSGCTAFRVGPLCSTSLPHRRYVSGSPGTACTVSGGLARAPQAISLAPEDHQTRLRDSVCPVSSQVQGHSVHLSVEQGCPCLACRSRGPTGEGRDRVGPSRRDEFRVLQPLLHRTQERRWVTTILGPARSEPGPSQGPVQDVDAETHLSARREASQFSSPRRTLLNFLPHPRQSGVAERQTPGPALVCCPRSVVIPLWVIPHVYSSTVRLPSR